MAMSQVALCHVVVVGLCHAAVVIPIIPPPLCGPVHFFTPAELCCGPVITVSSARELHQLLAISRDSRRAPLDTLASPAPTDPSPPRPQQPPAPSPPRPQQPPAPSLRPAHRASSPSGRMTHRTTSEGKEWGGGKGRGSGPPTTPFGYRLTRRRASDDADARANTGRGEGVSKGGFVYATNEPPGAPRHPSRQKGADHQKGSSCKGKPVSGPAVPPSGRTLIITGRQGYLLVREDRNKTGIECCLVSEDVLGYPEGPPLHYQPRLCGWPGGQLAGPRRGGGGCRDERARAAGARGRGARLATEGARSTPGDEAREDSETASARQMPRVQRGFCHFPRGRARCHSPLRGDLIRPLDRRALSTQLSTPLQSLILVRHSDSSGMASPTKGLCGIGRSCSSCFSFSD
ncbi:hypothetical protein C7M84_025292 [Penaeus vannamei]|uniref:Uncharacterized protein n=1 Tax=Penaeus vannamei TaxID=6689 RepID=A0A423TYK7_PENVA|nr:hypothetical protein C7M84_025292 [Penaeus vannamei]